MHRAVSDGVPRFNGNSNGSSSRSAQQDIPTIDLHGYRTAAALRAVTDFLEVHNRRCTPVVCVVTGSGSHSITGPVLRPAIEDLLQRRQMEFWRNDSGGSLLIRPSSGQTFFSNTDSEATASDERVVVVERHHYHHVPASALPIVPTPPGDRYVSGYYPDEQSYRFPTPAQSAAESRILNEARRVSAMDEQRRRAEEQRRRLTEEATIRRALEASATETAQQQKARQRLSQLANNTILEGEGDDHEYGDNVNDVPQELGSEQHTTDDEDDSERNRERPTRSLEELQAILRPTNVEELALQRALTESQLQPQPLDIEAAALRRALTESQLEPRAHEEEEAAFKRALEESQLEPQAVGEEAEALRRALEESQREPQPQFEEDEDVLNNILKESSETFELEAAEKQKQDEMLHIACIQSACEAKIAQEKANEKNAAALRRALEESATDTGGKEQDQEDEIVRHVLRMSLREL